MNGVLSTPSMPPKPDTAFQDGDCLLDTSVRTSSGRDKACSRRPGPSTAVLVLEYQKGAGRVRRASCTRPRVLHMTSQRSLPCPLKSPSRRCFGRPGRQLILRVTYHWPALPQYLLISVQQPTLVPDQAVRPRNTAAVELLCLMDPQHLCAPPQTPQLAHARAHPKSPRPHRR